MAVCFPSNSGGFNTQVFDASFVFKAQKTVVLISMRWHFLTYNIVIETDIRILAGNIDNS